MYEPQGTTIETAALLKELMVVNTNHTLLACLHSPSFMIETVCEAIEFVIANATTRPLQEACATALVRKCEILWAMLDGIEAAAAPGPALHQRVLGAGQRGAGCHLYR